MALVEYEVKDRIGYITLNRPDKMNAINHEMLGLLLKAFLDIRDNPDVWVGVIRANGKAFCSGHDLKEQFIAAGPTAYDLYDLQNRLYKPLISSINGACLAQGAGLALNCDIHIASENAEFGWPQVKRGIASVSGPTILTRRLPINVAFEILFTGEFISAQKALEYSLVNKVVPADQLEKATNEMAYKVLENAPLAIRVIKEGALLSRGMRQDEAFVLCTYLFGKIMFSEDAQEGLSAFAEKRDPVWKGS